MIFLLQDVDAVDHHCLWIEILRIDNLQAQNQFVPNSGLASATRTNFITNGKVFPPRPTHEGKDVLHQTPIFSLSFSSRINPSTSK